MLLFPHLINLNLKTVKERTWYAEGEVRIPLNFYFLASFFKKQTLTELSLVCLALLSFYASVKHWT